MDELYTLPFVKVHARKTEDYLTGKTLNNDTIQGAVAMLDAEIQPTMTPPDAHPEYRKALAQATFYKVNHKLEIFLTDLA